MVLKPRKFVLASLMTFRLFIVCSEKLLCSRTEVHVSAGGAPTCVKEEQREREQHEGYQ